jgi:hypothetical protein
VGRNLEGGQATTQAEVAIILRKIGRSLIRHLLYKIDRSMIRHQ